MPILQNILYHPSIFKKSGNEIPNPIQLLNRLSALESSLSTLKEDVHDLVLLRPLIASEATNSLLRNYNAIKEVSKWSCCV